MDVAEGNLGIAFVILTGFFLGLRFLAYVVLRLRVVIEK